MYNTYLISAHRTKTLLKSSSSCLLTRHAEPAEQSADKDCCVVYINCLSGCSSSAQVFLLKQKMVNKSTFGSSSYTSLSAFLFGVFNFASINPDCAFSFHMLRSKSPFFCKLPATHSHLVTLSSSFPQKDLGVKLPASLEADESACTSGKYVTLFLPSTWIRPKTQTCTT